MVKPWSGVRRAVLAAASGMLVVALLGLWAEAAVASAAPALAYVKQTEHSLSAVWTAAADGSAAARLGPGVSPLISPNGQTVAAGVFGTVAGVQETGPAIAVYSTATGAAQDYLSLGSDTATPIAWSADSRYVAVQLQSTTIPEDAQQHSGLVMIDTSTGTVTTVAHGQIEGASFATDGSDRIVYGRAPSQLESASVNLYVANPDGADVHELTRDGHSLNPVWGHGYIAYDHSRNRREGSELQIWLAPLDGRAPHRLTHIPVNVLDAGLVPLAISSDGKRMLAEFEGEDNSEAWTVSVGSGRARELSSSPLLGVGLSRDGRTVLVEEGGLEGPAFGDKLATVPFAGGRPRVLVAHAVQASWSE